MLDSLDTSNSVAAAIVIDGNQLRIPQGETNNLEASGGTASLKRCGAPSIFLTPSSAFVSARNGDIRRRLCVRSQLIVAALAPRSDLGLPDSKCEDLQPVEVLPYRDLQSVIGRRFHRSAIRQR